MITHEIIGKIKQRRQNNIAKSNSGLKEQVQLIRKQIVQHSFSKESDMAVHRKLMDKLEDTKKRLNQVSAFGMTPDSRRNIVVPEKPKENLLSNF